MDTTNTAVQRLSADGCARVQVGNIYNTVQGDNDGKRLRILQQLYRTDDDGIRYANNYESHKKRNPPRADGTCQWFLTSEKYLQLLESPSSSLLWLTADAGCGKSVLASTIVDELRGKNPSATVCYFFFCDDNRVQADGIAALRALLHQVLSATDAVPPTIATEYDAKGELAFSDLHNLWKLFISAVREGQNNVLCVLDGLDECEMETQKQLACYITEFYANKTAANNPQQPGRHPYLKVILTARPLNSITTTLCKLNYCRMRGEDYAGFLGSDIQLVITRCLHELVEDGLIAAETMDHLHSKIRKKHDYTFLWAALIMDRLRERCEAGASEIELIDALDDDSIYALYAKFLDQSVRQSGDADLTKCFFQIVLAAARPLTLVEMDYALSIRAEHKCMANLTSHLHLARENFFKQLGGSFVTLRGQMVRFIHQSAREFLLERSGRIGPPRPNLFGGWYNSLKLEDAHETLALQCSRYLLFRDFEEVPTPRSAAEEDCDIARSRLIKSHPFLYYASRYWHRHLRMGFVNGGNQELLGHASALCCKRDRRFWTWLFVYSPIWMPQITEGLTAAMLLHIDGILKLDHQDNVDEQVPHVWAALNGYVDLLKLLFIVSGIPYSMNPRETTRMTIQIVENCLASNGNCTSAHEVLHILLNNEVSFTSAIINFLYLRSTAAVEYFVERYPEVVCRPRTHGEGYSLLTLAVINNQPDMVRVLCKINCGHKDEFLNIADLNNNTTLYYAMIINNPEIIECLTDHGVGCGGGFGGAIHEPMGEWEPLIIYYLDDELYEIHMQDLKRLRNTLKGMIAGFSGDLTEVGKLISALPLKREVLEQKFLECQKRRVELLEARHRELTKSFSDVLAYDKEFIRDMEQAMEKNDDPYAMEELTDEKEKFAEAKIFYDVFHHNPFF